MSALPVSLEPVSPRTQNHFFLEGPACAWLVNYGSVELFAVERQSGVRHFLKQFESCTFLTGVQAEITSEIQLLVCIRSHSQVTSHAFTPEEACKRSWNWMEQVATIVGLPASKLAALNYDARQQLLLDRISAYVIEKDLREADRLRVKFSLANRDVRQTVEALTIEQCVERRRHTDEYPNPLVEICTLVAKQAGVSLAFSNLCLSVNELNVKEIAAASGVRVRQIALRGEWWLKTCEPLVAFRAGIPVALLACGRKLCLYDPLTRKTSAITERTARELGTTAFLFCRPLPLGSLRAWELVRFVLRGCMPDLFRIACTSLLCALLSLLMPSLVVLLFDSSIPNGDRNELMLLGGVLGVSAICTALFTLATNLSLLHLESRAATALELGVWDRLLRCPLTFFRKFSGADLAMRSFEVNQVRQLLSSSSLPILLSSCLTFVHVPLLFCFSGALGVPALIFILIAVVVSILLAYLRTLRQRAKKIAEALVTSSLLNFTRGIGKIRTAGAESRAFSIWAKRFANTRSESLQIGRLLNTSNVWQKIVPTMGLTFLFASWSYSFSNHSGKFREDAGLFLAFLASFQLLLNAALQVGSSVMSLAGIVPLVERLGPILEEPVEGGTGSLQPGRLSGAIQVKNVSFRYGADHPPTLNGISFRIEPGEFVAIVGSSGSGKSTLLRLLLGFEKAHAGTITYDGQDLQTLNLVAMRRQLGVVLQDGYILSGDIASAILSDTGLDLSAAWEAARIAGLDDDIRMMPMGMHTILSEGADCISGGQRQKLLIARAVAKQPSLLFLDEATSALDNLTQERVARQLQNIPATKIVIAHRLSTIRSADRIIVLEKGCVVEAGNYEELARAKGPFARLIERQIS